MTRKKLSIVFTLFIGFSYAQNIDLPTDYISNTTTGGLSSTIAANVKGSPYANEEFVLGKVFVNDDKPYNGILRYNAYSDGIEMKTENGIITLLKRSYLKARIGGKLYLIESYMVNGAIRKTYFVELSQGKARLLLKQGKKYVEARSASSSYTKDQPAKFEDINKYYIITEGEPGVEVRLKNKEVVQALPDHKKEVQAFIKSNKLKMKNEGEVIQVLNYYNTL